MKLKYFFGIVKPLFTLIILLAFNSLFAQQQTMMSNSRNEFWQKVQFGGGIGLSIGSNYTDITLAPSVIYNFNKYVSAGVGLQGSYVSSKIIIHLQFMEEICWLFLIQ